MAISDAQFDVWENDSDADRVCLVEIQYYNGQTAYIANKAYRTSPSDSPANTEYVAGLLEPVVIEESIEKNIRRTITLDNPSTSNGSGKFDYLVDAQYQGYEITIKIGDASWDIADFRQVAKGLTDEIRGDRKLTVRYSDDGRKFKLPLGDGGPVLTGTVKNASVVVETGNVYTPSDAALTSIDAVYDKGDALTITTNYTQSLTVPTDITLVSGNPDGRITYDATQGDSKINTILGTYCTRAGVTVNSTQVNALAVTQPALSGFFYEKGEEVTIQTAIDDLMETYGTSYYFNSDNELELTRLDEPASASWTFTTLDMPHNPLTESKVEAPVRNYKLKSLKNYTVQSESEMAGSVTVADRILFGSDYRDENTVQNALTGVPATTYINKTKVSNLINDSAASTECSRLAALRGEQRGVWKLKTIVLHNDLQIGDTVSITHPRRGFSAVDALVIGVRKSVLDGTMILTVWF